MRSLDLIRMNQICKELSVSKPTIYKYIELGMPVHKVNSLSFFDTKEIEAWIKNYTGEGQ